MDEQHKFDAALQLMKFMFMDRPEYIMIEMSMYAHDGARLSHTAAAVRAEDSNISELLLMAFETSGKLALEVTGELNIRVWHGDADAAREFATKNERLAKENADNPDVAVTLRNNLV